MISGELIEQAGRRLAAAARQPARVSLFGSHARGDAGPDSDLGGCTSARVGGRPGPGARRLRLAAAGYPCAARSSRAARRLWRRPTSAVAAARATIGPVPTTTVAVRARVIAV